jgi:hypothetical protein
VESGTLIVQDRGSSDTLDLSGDQLTVTVSTPRLPEARINGSGDVSLPELDGGPLRVRVGGSGDVDGHGRLDGLDAAIKGSGDIDVRERGRAVHRRPAVVAGRDRLRRRLARLG